MKSRDRVTFKSHGKKLEVPIEYGSIPVRLPEHPDVGLRLVVVKWPKCEKPMMLLITLRAARFRKSLRQVVVQPLGSGSPRQTFDRLGIVQWFTD